jgi:hypothetical protein
MSIAVTAMPIFGPPLLNAPPVAQQAARQRGGDVILRHPSHVVSRVLDLTGMREAFVIHD